VRTLIAAAAALLAVGTTSSVFAAQPATIPATSAFVQGLPDPGASVLVHSTTKKKKKKKSSSSKESAKFEEIGNAKRGKSDLEIKIKVSKTDRTCELKIKWKSGDTTTDEEDANDDKVCEFSIEVPGDRDVVGDATATVTVKDASGKKVASAKKTFPVK